MINKNKMIAAAVLAGFLLTGINVLNAEPTGPVMPNGATADGVVGMALSPVQGEIKFPHGVTSPKQMDKGRVAELEKAIEVVAPALQKALESLEAGKKLVVIGHADSIGGKGAAQSFGMSRAKTVINLLAAKGIPRDRLMPFSAADNDLQNKDNMKADENHRITFAVMQ